MSSLHKLSRMVTSVAFAFWLPTVPLPLVRLPLEQPVSRVARPVNSAAAFEAKADKFLKLIYVATHRTQSLTNNVQRVAELKTSLDSLSRVVDFRYETSGLVVVNVAVQLKTQNADELKANGFAVSGVLENIACVQVAAERLPELAALRTVTSLEASTYLRAANDRAVQGIGAAASDGSRLVAQTGKGVVVGIIDTGIDFRHPDFTKPNSNGQQTRIKALLDMTMYNPITIVVGGNNVTVDRDWDYTLAGGSFPSGKLYREADINAALQLPKSSDQNLDLVKQRDKHGHGTHVAGTAAGNGLGAPALPGRYAGVAPEADLIIVKANLSNLGEYVFGSFYQIDALSFIKEQAQALAEPFVINMSYGDHFGPHNGTQILDQAIDGLVSSGPGRVVCVAAGNSGNENIHAAADVPAGGDVVINVAQPFGGTPGFVELYYPGADRFRVTVTKPNGAVLGPFAYDSGLYNNLTPGDPHISLYNTTDPHYGSNNIFIGFTNAAANLGANPWTIRLHGDSVPAGGHLNAWIWQGNFTSFVDSAGRLTTPGESSGAISVGAWTTRSGQSTLNNYATFTSTGPTVDGRQKPDISAPGDFLYSSRSSDGSQLSFFYGSGSNALAAGVDPAKYGGLAGTSMSTPVVTGAVALILQANPNLTVDQIKEILKNTATHDAFTGPGWSPRFGWGKLNVAAAITAAMPNPIDDARFFVRQNYLDFLSREPDQGGWDYWTSQLAQCGTNQSCIEVQRINVSAAYFIEAEFQQTGSYVYRLYKASYGERPTYEQFGPDRSSVVGGVDLETGKQTFAENWVQRQAFVQKYPATLAAAEFINGVIATVAAGSNLDLSSKSGELMTEYVAGTNQVTSRARVLRRLIEYQELRDAEYNRAFVLMQYYGYLRRNPDDAGYQFWLDVLNNRVPGNFRGMVCAFINSAEYQLRFSTIVARNDHACSSIGP